MANSSEAACGDINISDSSANKEISSGSFSKKKLFSKYDKIIQTLNSLELLKNEYEFSSINLQN